MKNKLETTKNIDENPAIGVIPYGKFPILNLKNYSLNELKWPLGRPKRLKNGVVADMTKNDHLFTHPRKTLFLFPRFGVKANISVGVFEPDIIHKKYLKWLRFFNWRFFKILTKSDELLSKIDNGIFFLSANTFIKNIDSLELKKSKILSLIASKKRNLEGHVLRHVIVNFIRENKIDADIMGRGYVSFENKEDGLAPYNYSIIIENIQESNYFTEKLIDCFLCETVPIYWGDPNIGNHFEAEGMLICNSEEELKKALKSISLKDYESRLNWIKLNKKAALNYTNVYEKAVKLLKESLNN